MENLNRRLASTVVMILLIWLALLNWPLGPLLAFILVGVVITVGLWELYNIVERKGIAVWRICGITSGWLLALAGYSRIEGWGGPPLEFAAILFLFFSAFTVQLRRGYRDSILTLMGTFFGVLYVAAPLSAVFWIYSLDGGRWLIFFLFVVTCLNDIGAYFIGSRFGRRPLSPRLSPKKTLEGAIGGLLIGVAGSFLLGFFMQRLSPYNHFYWAPGDAALYFQALILAVLLSIVGQVGDLSESMLKRDVRIKDSGGSLSGHGGVLDMADSLLFTIPFTFFYAKSILGL